MLSRNNTRSGKLWCCSIPFWDLPCARPAFSAWPCGSPSRKATATMTPKSSVMSVLPRSSELCPLRWCCTWTGRRHSCWSRRPTACLCPTPALVIWWTITKRSRCYFVTEKGDGLSLSYNNAAIRERTRSLSSGAANRKYLFKWNWLLGAMILSWIPHFYVMNTISVN